MKKMIPVLVALVLIAVVVVVAFGGKISDKYSYGTEVADLDAYFGGGLAEGGADGELAIVLQDEVLEDRAVVFENHIYFELETVKEYLNDRFFLSEEEQLMLYTRAEDTLEVKFGERSFSDGDGVHETGYVICRQQGEKIYFAEEFLHDFADFSCERFEKHVQMYTEWGVRQTYEVSRDTQVRVKGGIKSPILKELAKGEKVEFLEEMETWSKVKTSDSLIGYVENKYLTNLSSELETPVTTRQPEEIPSLQMEGKVCLGWHSIGGVGGNDTLDAMLEEGQGLNVIAPTWFSLTDNEGNFRSFASEQYVKRAHDKGLKVWGVWDNFNYRNETGSEVSTYQVLSSTEKRKALETAIINPIQSMSCRIPRPISNKPEMGSAASPTNRRRWLCPIRLPMNRKRMEQHNVETAAGASLSPAMLALNPIPTLLTDRVMLKKRISRTDKQDRRCLEASISSPLFPLLQRL